MQESGGNRTPFPEPAAPGAANRPSPTAKRMIRHRLLGGPPAWHLACSQQEGLLFRAFSPARRVSRGRGFPKLSGDSLAGKGESEHWS
jgi:hypothetical protein